MSNRLGLRQLRAFHAVMVTGGVTPAAERLNLTQPAISKQLSALEHALGLKLFHRRSGRATVPTPQGVEFYRAIEATITGLDEIGTIASNISANTMRRLRVAATPPLINSAPLMTAVETFLGDQGDTHISLEPRHRLEIEDWVAARQIDLALALLPSNHPALTSLSLTDTCAVAVMRADHPLVSETTITPAQLAGERVILPSRQPLRTRIDADLRSADADLEVGLEASSAITCCRMAAAGLGVAICDPFSPTAFPGTAIVTRPWSPPVSLTYGVLFNGTQDMDPLAESLLDCIKSVFERWSAPWAASTMN